MTMSRFQGLFPVSAILFRCLRGFWLLAAPFILGACSTFSSPVDIEREEAFTGEFAVLSPRQEFRSLSESRWFEIETTRRECFGKIRFIDKSKGFEGYVGFLSVPDQWVIESDDSEIIVAGKKGYHGLVFSTDGGRTFRVDSRNFPGDVAFVSVHKKMIRVGLYATPDREGNGKGYVIWGKRIYYRNGKRQEEYAVNGRHTVDSAGRYPDNPERKTDRRFSDSDFEVSTLVVVEAPISKLLGEIGMFRVIKPKNYEFSGFSFGGMRLDKGIPDEIKHHVREVERLEDLKLPQATHPLVMSCKALDLPPRTDFGKDPKEFFEWYWKTKESHPDWPSPQQDEDIQQSYEKWKNGMRARMRD